MISDLLSRSLTRGNQTWTFGEPKAQSQDGLSSTRHRRNIGIHGHLAVIPYKGCCQCVAIWWLALLELQVITYYK